MWSCKYSEWTFPICPQKRPRFAARGLEKGHGCCQLLVRILGPIPTGSSFRVSARLAEGYTKHYKDVSIACLDFQELPTHQPRNEFAKRRPPLSPSVELLRWEGSIWVLGESNRTKGALLCSIQSTQTSFSSAPRADAAGAYTSSVRRQNR